MATNNVKFDRRNVNRSDALAFADEIAGDRNLPFNLVEENAMLSFTEVMVYSGRYPVSHADAYCRPDTDWISGIKHGQTKDGAKIINRLAPSQRNRICGVLAKMRDLDLSGYMSTLSAKVKATAYTEDGPQEITFYVNRVQSVVPTGPASQDEEPATAEDQG